MTEEPVEVIQADRDAVRAFHSAMLEKLMVAVKDKKAGDRMGEDEGDAGTLVQSFARHRLSCAAELIEALEWYGEQARLARLIHSEGDAGRHALANDGGARARSTLLSMRNNGHG